MREIYCINKSSNFKSRTTIKNISLIKRCKKRKTNKSMSSLIQLKEIAKQIQEINTRTKVDPNIKKKAGMAKVEMMDYFDLLIKDRERKRQKQQERIITITKI